MKKYQTLGMGAVVAAAAFSLFTLTAHAQQPPAAAPATPGTVAPVKPATPPPAAAKAPAATTPAATAATTPKKPKSVASACSGLDEASCKAKAPECIYVTPTAVNATTGKVQASHCKKAAGAVAKKPTTTPAATTPAPAKPAAKPSAPAPTAKQ